MRCVSNTTLVLKLSVIHALYKIKTARTFNLFLLRIPRYQDSQQPKVILMGVSTKLNLFHTQEETNINRNACHSLLKSSHESRT